jgi:hypothetical protein
MSEEEDVPVEVASRAVARDDQLEHGRQDQLERLLTQQSAQLNQLTQLVMLPSESPQVVAPIYETVAVARAQGLEGMIVIDVQAAPVIIDVDLHRRSAC